MSRSRLYWSVLVVALVASLVAVVGGPAPAGAGGSTITVNTTDDEVNGDGDCSLREATIASNDDTATDACPAGSGSDTIVIPAGTYTLSITNNGADEQEQGDLNIRDHTTLMGAGASTTTIDADGIDGVFEIDDDNVDGDVIVVFDGLTITGGDTGGDGGGIQADDVDLTVRNSVVTLNEAAESGGGIDNDDTGSKLTVVNSTISDNTAGEEGGAFRQDNDESVVVVTNSTLSGNTAESGGAIHIDDQADVTITGTTISGNSAIGPGAGEAEPAARRSVAGVNGDGCGHGGAFHQDEAPNSEGAGSTAIVNSTISGNDASCGGGGLYVVGNTELLNVTIFGNEAPDGGNIYNSTIDLNGVSGARRGNGGEPVSSTLTLTNTIVANATDGGDCVFGRSATLVSMGGNIDSDESCDLDPETDQEGVDPLLGALADNGGATRTHLPQTGSPAIDRGLDAPCPDDDQRDVTRPQDGDDDGTATCESGAVELVPAPPPEEIPESNAAPAVEEQPDFTG